MHNLGNSVLILSVLLNVLLLTLYNKNRNTLAKTERTLEYERNKISQLEDTVKALNSARAVTNNPTSYQLLQSTYARNKPEE